MEGGLATSRAAGGDRARDGIESFIQSGHDRSLHSNNCSHIKVLTVHSGVVINRYSPLIAGLSVPHLPLCIEQQFTTFGHNHRYTVLKIICFNIHICIYFKQVSKKEDMNLQIWP